MTSPIEISVSQLQRRIGLRDQPVVLDVRIAEDVAGDPRRLPASEWRDFRDAQQWASAYVDRDVIVICQKGLKLSQGVAALIRHAGGPGGITRRWFRSLARGRRPTGEPQAVPAPSRMVQPSG